jgi:LPS-assembly protein
MIWMGYPLSALGAPDKSLLSSSKTAIRTLWYPGPYDPNAAPPVPVRTPITTPSRMLKINTPLGSNYKAAQPISSLPQPGKPLGTLWYPGPFTSSVSIPTSKTDKPLSLAPMIKLGTSEEVKELSNFNTKDSDGKFNQSIPIHLSADEMSFDEETGKVVAKGNVSIKSDGRRLVADSISYNQKNEVVTAKGNVQLIQPGGDQIFGTRMDISGDLKDAIIRGIGVILADRSRIVASSARRFKGNVTEMYNSVYSPCNLCEPDPTEPPLWQVKAVKVIHDKNRKTIEYRDAWVEVMGLPVAYTPYLSHPDPSVKRQSGFLVPSFGSSSDLGAVGRVPYFFDLGTHRDATLTALVTGEGSGGIAEYRQRFPKGTVDANGSIVLGDEKHDIRGHINSRVKFDANKTWRWGFDLNRTTDDTFLRRYSVSSQNSFGYGSSLNSQLFAEGFRQKNYFKISAYSFQGIQPGDDSDTEPIVLPIIDFNHIGKPDRFGGQTILDANFLAITREEGTKTRRLSIRPGWQVPFKDQLGGVYKFSTSLNADFYHAEDLERTHLETYNGFSSRITPQVMLDWRLPFMKYDEGITQVVEPIAVAIISPYGGNTNKIPNEDSQSFEFDDTNLLTANRFSGIDRVEGGPRAAYGLKWGAFGENGGKSELFFGQAIRPKSDDTFSEGSGLEDTLSDVVGRIDISPGPYLNLLYRTRLDSDNFTPKRNEIAFNAGGDALRVSTNYVFLEDQIDSQFGGREEVSSSINSKFTRFWRGAISGVHNITTGDARHFIGTMTYENECLVFTTNVSRKFYKDRDLEATDMITFNVNLKTLGSITSDIYQR